MVTAVTIESREAPTLRRAVFLMTLTGFMVPAAGVITAPILARALSTDGRGELAAAISPAALVLAAATLGLPDALTYHVAKRPHVLRPALGWSSLITAGLGVVCVLLTWLLLPFLSAGDAGLGRLILLGAVLTVPALVVGVFRGAAIGAQMWLTVSIERLLNSGLRVVCFGALFLTGHLTLFAAVLVNVVLPIVCGVVYLPMLRRRAGAGPVPTAEHQADEQAENRVLAPLVAFGSRIWFGSVASMLLSRASQLLMLPLSSSADLGLYTVASTISDLPLVVALAIQGALFGVNSKSAEVSQITRTSRVTLLAGAIGCAILGGTLPFWIGALFGPEFRPATLPTIMLLVSAVLCIPGLMAATGLSAWDRPGLRSTGLVITLVVNVGAFVVLVPLWGVYGACWTSILSNVVMTGWMVGMASRVLKVRPWELIGVSWRDFALLRAEFTRILSRVLPRSRAVVTD
jgi:O-antigen/teichoic acid export membrane protein